MESASRIRYKTARDELNAMKTSTTSAEFSTALLAFLTFGRSVLDVARSEAARRGGREPMKHRIEDAEKGPLVAFFIGARNAALKENRYERMHATVSIEPTIAIRFHITSGDVLISPSRGIDESKEPRQKDILEIEVREGKPAEASASVDVKQEFYFASGPYSGQSVIGLSEQFLTRLETVVNQVEESIGNSSPVTNPSSGSAR